MIILWGCYFLNTKILNIADKIEMLIRILHSFLNKSTYIIMDFC